jgi:hypothetical protein
VNNAKVTVIMDASAAGGGRRGRALREGGRRGHALRDGGPRGRALGRGACAGAGAPGRGGVAARDGRRVKMETWQTG